MLELSRAEILDRFRKSLAEGNILLGVGAGTGITAKSAEAGGADIFVIYNSGRFRMAGRGSLAGLLSYGDANQIVVEMGAEVLPVVKDTPVLAGVCGTDPFRVMKKYLAELKDQGFNGVQQGLNGVTNAMQQGFNGTNVALMQGQNALATQLADCCCKTQTAIQGVNYNLATQECDTRNQMQQGFCATQNAMNNNTRDIIENQNSNTRAVLDFLTNDKIATLQSENNELRRAASQDRQSAFLTTAMNAQTNQIIGTLQQKAPVPAYQVPNPNAIYYGCGTGCGNCA